MAPKTIISKRNGWCFRCRRTFPKGTVIEWARGVGSVHANPDHCTAAASVPPPATVIVNLRPIADLLMAAQASGGKGWARFKPADGETVEFGLFGVNGLRSKVPGSIQVYVSGEWVGRAEPPDSRIVGRRLVENAALLRMLEEIAANPTLCEVK
jgi:hypothetical protein